MNNDFVRLKTIVMVGSELRVFEADLSGLLQFVAVCASVGALNSATVVVKSAMLSAFAWIRLSSAHGALTSAGVAVRGVLLILEANICGRLSQFVAIGAGGASLKRAAILVSFTM